MDFAPEPVLDAFTPPPTRQAPRAPAPDDNGRTFDDHLDAVNEAPAERPAPAKAEAKEDAPPVEAKPAPDAETHASDEPLDPNVALLGGPTPPPMAAPVVVQIAASQPEQQAQPQNADADLAPVMAPEAPAPVAPPTDATAAEPVDAAPAAAKRGETEVKPAAPETPQQNAQQQPAQTTQQAQAAPQQTAPQAAAAQVEVQELPAAVQQAIAQTIAPAPQALVQATPRTTAKTAAQPAEATTEVDPRQAKAEAPAQNGNAKAQAPKAAANGNVAIETVAAPVAQASSSAPDPSQLTQSSAISTTASQASTHVQHAAVDTGAQRAAPAAAQVGREIIRRFDGGNTNFELRLDPAELGRVEVRMEVTRDHRVTAVITADNPQALTELARNARELEQQLQSAGLQLGDNGLSFDLRQGGQGGGADEANNGARGADGSETPAEQQPTQVARPIGYERWRGVRVDMMV